MLKDRERGLPNLIAPDTTDLVTPEQNGQTFLLEGPTNELTIKLEIVDSAGEVLMQDTIVKKLEAAKERQSVPDETTLLYLKACEMGLGAAKKNHLNFRWLFTATNPKMDSWYRKHVDTEEADQIRSEVGAEEIAEELTRVSGLLQKLKIEEIGVTAFIVNDPVAHEKALHDKITEAKKLLET